VDATLLALGLHADTGSLCYASTTPRDARALTRLLEQGADPALCSRYLHRPLDAARRAIVGAVLAATESHILGGLTVGIACVPLQRAPSGLDEVTARAHDALDCAALFVLIVLPRGRVQLIGRSRVSAVDAGSVLAELGGGGHASAAAAALKQVGATEARERLLGALRARAPAALSARELMSSPVHTVTPETSLRELVSQLSTWGHTGACVVRDGRVLSVISRTDLSKAQLRGQLDRKVKSFMSPRLIGTTPDAPLERVLELLERHDIGRLPVLEGDRLLGIVTRSDVRRALYGSAAGAQAPP
jgi:tRNA nucleotidyltransferase (CCA-adding enzyme)